MDNLTKFCNTTNLRDPRTINFEEIELDEEITFFIKTINKSNWVYTIYSCQGHHHQQNAKSLPYCIFIVDNNKIKEFLYLIYNTLPTHTFNPITPFIGAHELKIAQEYKDQNYTLISTYWDDKCIENKEFYEKLNVMAEQTITPNKYLLPPT